MRRRISPGPAMGCLLYPTPCVFHRALAPVQSTFRQRVRSDFLSPDRKSSAQTAYRLRFRCSSLSESSPPQAQRSVRSVCSSRSPAKPDCSNPQPVQTLSVCSSFHFPFQRRFVFLATTIPPNKEHI